MSAIHEYFTEVIDSHDIGEKWRAGLLAYGEAIAETITEAKRGAMIEEERRALYATASRLYDIGDTYEANDNGETVETIADTLTNDPLSIINSLVDMIEDLNA